jgi:hypothetical protein
VVVGVVAAHREEAGIAVKIWGVQGKREEMGVRGIQGYQMVRNATSALVVTHHDTTTTFRHTQLDCGAQSRHI